MTFLGLLSINFIVKKWISQIKCAVILKHYFIKALFNVRVSGLRLSTWIYEMEWNINLIEKRS